MPQHFLGNLHINFNWRSIVPRLWREHVPPDCLVHSKLPEYRTNVTPENHVWLKRLRPVLLNGREHGNLNQTGTSTRFPFLQFLRDDLMKRNRLRDASVLVGPTTLRQIERVTLMAFLEVDVLPAESDELSPAQTSACIEENHGAFP